jgi:hypothetical protein
MGKNNMANNNEQKSILEVFGSKSQDGDKVKGLLLNALMRNSYQEGGEVEEVNWAEILKEKGLDMETIGGLNKAIGRNLQSWEMHKQLFNPEHYKHMEKEYEDIWAKDPEWRQDWRQQTLGYAEDYKQYLQDYSSSKSESKEVGDMFYEKMGTEKEKGIMALLQRLIPGGKTGYKE